MAPALLSGTNNILKRKRKSYFNLLILKIKTLSLNINAFIVDLTMINLKPTTQYEDGVLFFPYASPKDTLLDRIKK